VRGGARDLLHPEIPAALVTADAWCVAVSEALIALVGRAPGTSTSRFTSIVHPEDVPTLVRTLARVHSTGRMQRVYCRLVNGSGGSVPVLITVRPSDARGSMMLEVVDVAALVEPGRAGVDIDLATGVASRVAFRRELETAIDASTVAGSPFAVVVVDIDDFRSVNELVGHDAGDTVLAQVAQRLAQVHGGRGVVARLSGASFVALVHATLTPADALKAAQRLLEALDESYVVAGRSIAFGAHAGVVWHLGGPQSAETLIREASAAGRRARQRGEGAALLFDDTVRIEVVEQARLRSELRSVAMTDELVLHYQPVVDVDRQTVEGAEALVRWQHPELGLLAPGAFIPLAEQSGVTSIITQWVLGEAIRQLGEWIRQGVVGPGFVLSVNISARDLSDPQLVDLTREALEREQVAGSAVCLEITETALMPGIEACLDVATTLRGLGVHIAVDDFGVGYSSLGYLRELPVDAVKVDRAFVNAIDRDHVAEAIVVGILALARSLDLKVVAEGVERESQRERLVHLGLEQAQGFLWSAGRPAPDFERYLELATRSSAPRPTR
jgi:diguanylate cyclase (GGDEF)-like protein